MRDRVCDKVKIKLHALLQFIVVSHILKGSFGSDVKVTLKVTLAWELDLRIHRKIRNKCETYYSDYSMSTLYVHIPRRNFLESHVRGSRA
jgi:hypothetical protein